MTTAATQDVRAVQVPAQSRPGRGRKRRTWRRVCVFLAPAAVLLVMAWHYRWVGDDGFINYRIVQQIRAGNGPVFNRGERVEAGTSPLWISILAFADFVTPVRLEWLAVYLGIASAASGVALATFGTFRLLPPRRPGVLLPLGAIAFVAIPAAWTYSTGGLEGGLSLAWIGGSWFCLARDGPALREEQTPDRWFVPVLLGLGALIRPDLAVVSFGFFIALVCVNRGGGWTARLRALALALVLPVAFEIFRMGYYGLLVPNTALAKEASLSYFSQGWRYLADFNETYWLVVPVGLLLVLSVVAVTSVPGRLQSATGVLTIAALSVGVALGLYWVRVGGDWMHARVLLPALFCLLLPTMTVRARDWQIRVAIAVMIWAVWCGISFREPARGRHGIVDPRAAALASAKGNQIVTIDDYRRFGDSTLWSRLDKMAASGQSGVLLYRPDSSLSPLPLAGKSDRRSNLIYRSLELGMIAYGSGPDVYIADAYALADPVGSHLRYAKRGRPGHEKLVPIAWVVGRFAQQDAPLPESYEGFFSLPTQLSAREVKAARAALQCGDLRDMLAAANDPLTPGRFLQNIFAAPRLTNFRVSEHPIAAERTECH